MPGAETPRADCLVADLSPLFFTALLPFRFLSLGRGVFADRLVPKARLPGVCAGRRVAAEEEGRRVSFDGGVDC